MKGVYVGLCLPWSSRAASVAIRPSTCSSASITCQRESTLLALATNVRMTGGFLPGLNRATANPNDTHACRDCQAVEVCHAGGARAALGLTPGERSRMQFDEREQAGGRLPCGSPGDRHRPCLTAEPW